ncbi:YjeF N-terminal domain-containing protein [Blastocladiella britannica]|nr:YjeF N-terminal domain-containing protein [Blastocladiella britannica]
MAAVPVNHISQRIAQVIDSELMSVAGGFTLEQLMELAGLAVAQAAARIFPLDPPSPLANNRVLVCCGPGNNGGDGLVAARHLVHFGYQASVYYPKQGANPFFGNLKRQLMTLGVQFVPESSTHAPLEAALVQSKFLLDAVFGFSFQGPIKAPFDELITRMNRCQRPILSVDIPSGWHVEEGKIPGEGIESPYALISLTAPKQCAAAYKGIHYLGGRFVPPATAQQFGLVIPQYPGTDQIVQLS